MHQLLFICYYNNYDSWRWYHNWVLRLMVQPGGNMWKCSMNIQVSVALKRTVIGSSWCFDHLSSHSDDERKGPDHSHYHSGDDFCLICRNVSHLHWQQSLTGPHSPRGSDYTITNGSIKTWRRESSYPGIHVVSSFLKGSIGTMKKC